MHQRRSVRVSERLAVVLVPSTGFFGFAINGTMQFLLPLRAVELGYSLLVVGLLLGTKSLVEAVLSLPIGRVIDRVGARPVFIGGAAGMAGIGIVYTLSTQLVVLFVLQAVLGVIRPLVWVGGQSYVSRFGADTDRARNAGRFAFSANSAQIAVPLVAGVLAQSFGVQRSFAILIVLALVFTVVGWLLPQQAGAEVTAEPVARGLRASTTATLGLLKIPNMQAAMLLTSGRLFVPAVWVSFFPLLLVQSGVAEGIAGTVVSLMGAMSTVVSLNMGRIGRLATPIQITAGGLAVAAVGLLVAPWTVAMPLAYLPALLIGVGQGVSLPMLIVIVADAAPADQRALALGLRASVNQVASMTAPVLTGAVISAAGVTAGFPLAAAIVGALVGGGVVASRRRKEGPVAGAGP